MAPNAINTSGHRLPVVLSIAGSDCSGGAGIQADIKTCSEFGVYCMTVITAVTAQNPAGVARVDYVGADMLRSQLECIASSLRPDAIKTGMLPCAEGVEIVADFIERNKWENVVVDPVLKATSGGSLSGNSQPTAEAAKRLLFPLATVVTPNIPELYSLSGLKNNVGTDEAAREFMSRHQINAVLVKGGHSDGDECTDSLYYSNGTESSFSAIRIDSDHTHGTGCTLSSAIACGLASGKSLDESVALAKRFITGAIRRGLSYRLFPANGPLCHFDPTKH
jgi:hydroxymethylpyrimidine/phosphomethylpyrimidine kinase